MTSVDEVVDRFVDAVTTRRRDRRLERDLSPSVRDTVDDEGYWTWRIVSCDGRKWLKNLSPSLPAPLPKSYASLVSRYCFPAFETQSFVLHANTSEATGEFEFRQRLFHDKAMSPFLLRNGFIQVGKPLDWGYDPVCFNTKTRTGRGPEYSLVRLDHEEILIRQRVQVVQEIAGSFLQVMQQFVAAV